MFEPLAPLSYDVIVADPPWSFDLYSERGNAKSASAQYSTMTLADIEALPVGQLARGDAILFLWSTAPTLPHAMHVLHRWGFTYKTHLIWRKVYATSGKVRWGTGYRARSGHETILLGTIGNPKQASAIPSIFDGAAREHSRKPDEFYALVHRHTLGLRRADLFSRETRPGFEAWGNEAGKFDARAA